MANRCSLCMQSAEFISDLFISYPAASLIWNFFLRRFKRQWVISNSMSSLIHHWDGEKLDGLSSRGKAIGRVSQ